MAGALNQRDLSPMSLLTLLKYVLGNVVHGGLPSEIEDHIYSFIRPVRAPTGTAPPLINISSHPALKPPANGRCMIQALPTELRCKIFGKFLPNKDAIIRPLCRQYPLERDPKRAPQHNRVSDLMILSKRFKDDVTKCVYSERSFDIHVHEGIANGGIEFLDTGRQPLHYKSSISDTRFERFDDGEFGFSKLKKIIITIYPSTELGRHNAMTTYFINHALVRMLERSGEDDRIVSLTIQFAQTATESIHASQTDRQGARSEHDWWNQEADAPRSTSIHGISDVELALRPFAMLTTVHDVRIYLPTKVSNHAATIRFAAELERSMKSNTALGTLGPSDELDRHVEALRDEIESFIFREKYGNKHDNIPNLNEEDACDDIPNVTKEDIDEDRLVRAALLKQKEEGHGDDLTHMRSHRSQSLDYEPDEEQASAGFNHPLRRRLTGPRPPKKLSINVDVERSIEREFVIKKSNGSRGPRVAYVDTYNHSTFSQENKNPVQRGLSTLDIDQLGVSDENDNVGKTPRRYAEDSPGRSRAAAGRGYAQSLSKTVGTSGVLDFAELAREREARAVASRASKWD